MDWRKLANNLALVDGRITARRAAVIADELLAEGAVDKDEAEFLVNLKRAAVSAPPEFDRLVHEVMRQVVLMDGVISAAEAHWLRRTIFADQVVSPFERHFLEELRRAARSVSPEFEALYRDCLYSPEFSRT